MCERGVLASVFFGLFGIECHEHISLAFYEEGWGFQHIHMCLRFFIFGLVGRMERDDDGDNLDIYNL